MIANKTTMAILIVSAAATIFSRGLFADEPLLLIKTHSASRLTCAQCHQERPPTSAPSNAPCLGCHGDQQALAQKTEGASPNPHAPPHLPPGETQVCSECHNVHKQSAVSCSSCHHDFFFNVK